MKGSVAPVSMGRLAAALVACLPILMSTVSRPIAYAASPSLQQTEQVANVRPTFPDVGVDDYADSCKRPAGYRAIRNAAELQAMNSDLNAKYFLCNDIELSGFSFIPIGNYFSNSFFQGVLDGNGKSIRGLTFGNAGVYSGIFSVIGESGEVRNLLIDSPQMNGGGKLGAIAGASFGTIRNSHVLGSGIIQGDSSIGGLVGSNSGGSIIASSIGPDITVIGRIDVGGLVGHAHLWTRGRIEQTISYAEVQGETDNIGGLVGTLTLPSGPSGGTAFFNNAAYGDVSVSGNLAGSTCMAWSSGGLVGKMSGFASVSGLTAAGTVSSCGNRVGGLIGTMEGTRIARSSSHGNVSANLYVGGMIGYQTGSSSSVTESFSTGSISGVSCVGGLVGFQAEGSVSDSYTTGTVSGEEILIGGISGYTFALQRIERSFALGVVNGGAGTIVGRVGGLLPKDWGTTLFDSFINSTANPSSTDYPGAEGRTMLELRQIGTFGSNWSISPESSKEDTIWKIAEPDGSNYPRLGWE